MKRLQKQGMILASLIFSIVLLLNIIPFSANAEEQKGKEQAVSWLKEMGEESGEWENDGLPNFTCNAMAVFREEKSETESAFLTKWEQEHTVLNVDELAHLAWARGSQSYLDTVWEWQNEDGGFGLTRSYTSDVYDTMLVLLAQEAVWENDGPEGNTDSRDQKNSSDKMAEAVNYLIGQQKADGGFGYTKMDASVPDLSAQVGIVLLLLDIENDSVYEKLDSYCQSAFTADFSEETFSEQAKLAGYLYKRELIKNTDDVEKQLNAAQAEDGSIYGSIKDTIQYILLAREIKQYHALKFEIETLITEADNYVLEADREQQVSLQTTIQYTINQEMNAVIRYTLLEDGEIVKIEEKECLFIPEQEEQKADAVMDITASEGRTYVLRTEVLSQEETGKETIWKITEFDFSVHKTEKKELILQAETCGQEDYSVDLSWNDISDQDNHYGYRVFRKKGDGEWETRSTWDGEEKVKVLNIYPASYAEKYLADWMEKTLSSTEEPAGKGLFEIDTVYIDEYNTTPNAFLQDENGDYQYDVLVFGICNANEWKDISQAAYEATVEYANTGRGVLFGHDTVSSDSSSVNFSKFADSLGIIVKQKYNYWERTKVKVVNTGFLTSYPWKLSGTLTIPATHISGQFAGGSLPATVWMELDTPYETDDLTGAKTNAYLVTNNQFAMIQTGHSNGQATDDERKVIANTLFYLKQLTNKTSASDKSFYDEAAPEITGVSEMTPEGQVVIEAKDAGTLYRYYVEAVNAGSREEESRQSNIVEAEARSGIKGYIIGMSDTEAPMETLLSYDEEGTLVSEILPAEDGTLSYTPEDLAPGEIKYLHIYAVDYAGNISAETVCKVEAPEQVSGKAYFNSAYAFFALENAAEVYCCEAKINGDVYGKEAFRFQGTTLLLDGKASTAGILSLAGGKMELAEREEGIEPPALPDYTGEILRDIENENDVVDEFAAYNSTEITVPTICQSTTGAWCNDVRINASLISEKGISLNANTISCGTDDKVVLCSQDGDIQMQATKFHGSGLIYAPNGTVTINVSEFHYTGTIIAKKIKIQASYINLNQ